VCGGGGKKRELERGQSEARIKGKGKFSRGETRDEKTTCGQARIRSQAAKRTQTRRTKSEFASQSIRHLVFGRTHKVTFRVEVRISCTVLRRYRSVCRSGWHLLPDPSTSLECGMGCNLMVGVVAVVVVTIA
jgi:ribosomal protein L44E